MAEAIGWLAAVILLATIGRQVHTQWQSGSTAGVSKWLFTGQIAASVGFVIYSYLKRDWVFVATNSAILLTALIGQVNYLRQTRKAARGTSADTAETSSVAAEPVSGTAVLQTVGSQ